MTYNLLVFITILPFFMVLVFNIKNEIDLRKEKRIRNKRIKHREYIIRQASYRQRHYYN